MRWPRLGSFRSPMDAVCAAIVAEWRNDQYGDNRGADGTAQSSAGDVEPYTAIVGFRWSIPDATHTEPMVPGKKVTVRCVRGRRSY